MYIYITRSDFGLIISQLNIFEISSYLLITYCRHVNRTNLVLYYIIALVLIENILKNKSDSCWVQDYVKYP